MKRRVGFFLSLFLGAILIVSYQNFTTQESLFYFEVESVQRTDNSVIVLNSDVLKEGEKSEVLGRLAQVLGEISVDYLSNQSIDASIIESLVYVVDTHGAPLFQGTATVRQTLDTSFGSKIESGLPNIKRVQTTLKIENLVPIPGANFQNIGTQDLGIVITTVNKPIVVLGYPVSVLSSAKWVNLSKVQSSLSEFQAAEKRISEPDINVDSERRVFWVFN